MVEGFWFTEEHTKNVSLSFRVKKVLFYKKSQYQEIVVLDTYEFGKMLVLDGAVMTTEKDEFIYHEMLVHPAMVVHPYPKDIIVIGGGDGGVAREILKYKEVKNIIMVEIDKDVVETSKRFFPNLAKSFEDKRLKLKFMDGFEFLKNSFENFDIIFVDSPDPVGHAKILFSEEFYEEASKKTDILVAQMETPFYYNNFIKNTLQILKKHFEEVHLYFSPVPTYPSGWWSYVFCSHGVKPFDFIRTSPKDLKYYNFEIHKSSFALPNFLKELLK